MLQTEIRRNVHTPAIPKTLGAEPVQEVLERAGNVLGYKPYLSVNRPVEVVVSSLAQRLAALDIDVLNRSDVLRYQAEHAAEQMLTDEFHQLLCEDRSGGSPWNYLDIWIREEIDGYRQPIPEFVLNKAIQIKEAMPEVKIWVEHLKFGLDPFLVVTDGERWKGTSEYVEVWAEPKFEGRATR